MYWNSVKKQDRIQLAKYWETITQMPDVTNLQEHKAFLQQYRIIGEGDEDFRGWRLLRA